MTTVGPVGQAAGGSADLVGGLRRRDPTAVEVLLSQHGPVLLAIARSILGDEQEAMDAVQDGILSVLRGIDTLRDSEALVPWIKKTVTNAALAHLRKKKRRRERPIEELLPRFIEGDGHRVDPGPSWVPLCADRLESQELQSIVRDLIEQLPDHYREVLVVRDLLGLDTRQAASVLEIPPNLVKVRLHRARQALRGLLEERLDSN